MSASDVDSASNLKAILGLYEYPFYSMFNSYHSLFYGWTFYSITSIIYLPFKILNDLSINSFMYDAIGIKLIFFIYGYILIISHHILLNFFLNNKFKLLSLLLTFNLIIPFDKKLFIQLHPEIIGMFFLNLAILFLFKYKYKFKYQHNYKFLVFSALSAYSKQVFIFLLIPLFFYYVFQDINLRLLQKVKEIKRFLKFCFIIFFVFLAVFLFVHPYAFFDVKKFLTHQTSLFFSFQGESASFFLSCTRWIALVLNNDLILAASLISSFLIFIIYLATYFYHKIFFQFIVLFSITLIFLFVVIAKGNSQILSLHYLNPLIIFSHLILSLLFIQIYLKIKNTIFKKLIYVIFSFFLILNIFLNYKNLNTYLYERLDYQNTLPYLIYNKTSEIFVNEPNAKIAHDHFVSIHSDYIDNSCHYWTTCPNYDSIVIFNPDYIILNPNFSWLNKPHEPTENLKKYIIENGMILVNQVYINDPNKPKIYIYKKN